MALMWEKQPLTRQVARALRAATHRIQFDGHVFGYNDLKEMWMDVDGVHVVCTHEHDPAWQYWHREDNGAWKPVGAYETIIAAQKIAQGAHDDSEPVVEPPISPGTYVLARFKGRDNWMRTRIMSKDGVQRMIDIWDRLGCEVTLEQVDDVA
jgi:hypothetical protein